MTAHMHYCSWKDGCKKLVECTNESCLKPLNADDLPQFVERACEARGVAYDERIVKSLKRAKRFRPLAIANTIDDLAAGKSITTTTDVSSRTSKPLPHIMNAFPKPPCCPEHQPLFDA